MLTAFQKMVQKEDLKKLLNIAAPQSNIIFGGRKKTAL